MSLKYKTIKGVFWNAFEMFGGKLIQIIITIILARILSPDDFGIIGLLVIFTELSKVILDSGFSQALIRKKDADQSDFTSVFYFNIVVGIVVYTILYFITPFISDFYKYPELTDIARVVFLSTLINSFGIVQNAKVIREVNFKTLAKRTIIANILAGLLAIYLAYVGFGVWALVIQMVLATFLRVLLLWTFSKWLPSLSFSFKPIKKLFAFSGNLLMSGIFDVIVSNIQTLLIGKFYSKAALGFYTQGKQLSSIPAQTLTGIVRNVTYPTLSVIQENIEELKHAYKKIIKIAVFVIMPLMLGLLAIGENLIPFILGDKWIPSVNYFMLLCITGAFFPLYSMGQNLFLVRGNSRLYLKVSILKRVIALVAILITIRYSVLTLVIGQVITSLINTVIMMAFSGIEINYHLKEQIKDIGNIIIISIITSGSIYIYGRVIHIESILYMLGAQSLIGVIIFVILIFMFRLSVLTDLKEVIFTIKNKKDK